MLYRSKRFLVLCVSLLIVAGLVALTLPASTEQPVRLEFQPWFNPAAEVFTNPDVLQNPELFSRNGLETLWNGVHGLPIGPDCPLLLCATHPLGLALIAGGLIKAPNEEEARRLAETLMSMGAAFGNRYHTGIPVDNLGPWHSQVEALCQILSLRAELQDRPDGRRMTIFCDAIDPNIPLYTDELTEISLIRRCLEQCPCASFPHTGPNGDPGEQPPVPPGQLDQPPPPIPPGQPAQPLPPVPPGQPDQPPPPIPPGQPALPPPDKPSQPVQPGQPDQPAPPDQPPPQVIEPPPKTEGGIPPDDAAPEIPIVPGGPVTATPYIYIPPGGFELITPVPDIEQDHGSSNP